MYSKFNNNLNKLMVGCKCRISDAGAFDYVSFNSRFFKRYNSIMHNWRQLNLGSNIFNSNMEHVVKPTSHSIALLFKNFEISRYDFFFDLNILKFIE